MQAQRAPLGGMLPPGGRILTGFHPGHKVGWLLRLRKASGRGASLTSNLMLRGGGFSPAEDSGAQHLRLVQRRLWTYLQFCSFYGLICSLVVATALFVSSSYVCICTSSCTVFLDI